jgi:pimeloyl-ACP methyl ester carboxylesterase
MKSISSKDGTKIAYTRSGDGPALVLVHGAAADYSRWTSVLTALEGCFTVYAMDRRGRGASGDSAGYAIAREFDDVAALVDSIGEPVVLLGHSYGAICSLEAALRTNRVRKLVLYEPPIPAGLPIYAPGLIERLQVLLDKGEKASVVTTFLTEIVHMPEGEVNILQSQSSWSGRVAAAHTIPRELRAAEGYRFDPLQFKAFNVPTLLLLGGDSPAFFKAAIDVVHASLQSSRLVILPGQQHVAMNTAPDLFLNQVLTFIAE